MRQWKNVNNADKPGSVRYPVSQCHSVTAFVPAQEFLKMTYLEWRNRGRWLTGNSEITENYLPGPNQFRLTRPGPGKSSSGDWKITVSDFGWTKSSQKSLSRTKFFLLISWDYSIKFFKNCRTSSFNSGSNKSSLALQFKWLDNT